MQQQLFERTENILPFNGEAFFFPSFFSKAESDKLFQHLQNKIEWKQEPIKIFGKDVMQPRLTAWYGDEGNAYKYSGITMEPLKWEESLLFIKQKIEPIAHVNFNSALLNQYRDGKDSMGWHGDNEKELGTNPVIGSVSFGAARKFQLCCYHDKSRVKSIGLSHGSFLLMQGQTQHYWEHQIPKTSMEIPARINITFRIIV